MITKSYSFEKNGVQNDVYTLTNKKGAEVDILTYGARILRISVPDKTGKFGDVIVGCKTPEDYYGENPYFGATVGRFANRIGNARFTLNGETYTLQANEGNNILHGGIDGDFSRKVWSAKMDGEKLVLSHFSPDGESGFPGNFSVSVCFTWTDENELVIDYEATCDKDTVCNLTNHSYFNIGDEDTVLSHELFINSKQITPCDDELIPHGDLQDIDGTAFSFAPAKRIGTDIFSDDKMIKRCNGYDFNYVLAREKDGLEHFAYVYDEKTGRRMDCYTTLPAVQLYTACYTGGFVGKKTYATHCALCLETQGFPNSPNCETYPSALLRAGETYQSRTVYRFSVVE